VQGFQQLTTGHTAQSVETWQHGAMGFAILAFLSFAGTALLIAHHNSEGERLKRLLRTASVRELAAAADGAMVRIVGTTYTQSAQSRVLRGPITGRSCLMYIVTVEYTYSSGDSFAWKQLIRETNEVPFLLRDATGIAIVDPTAAITTLKFDHERESAFHLLQPLEREFLAKHGHTSEGQLANKLLRYREAIVEAGGSITVLGMGVREPDPEGTPAEGYRSAAPTRMRFTSSPKHPLVISDDPTTTRSAPKQLPPSTS
jgi:hypothetical protein